MVMQDKIQKINSYCFILYFIMAIISVLLPIPDMAINVLGVLLIVEMYGIRIVLHYLIHKKISAFLILILLVYVIWNGVLLKYNLGGASRIVTMILAYFYIIVADKLNTGKVSKRFIRFAVFFLAMEMIRYFFHGTIVTVSTILTQTCVIFIMIDPIMYGLAKKGKETRGEINEHVPLVRKILFGKTGKLRTDILKGKEEPGSAFSDL